MSNFSINVEVTDETYQTGKATQQRCYVDLGGKYPEPVGRFVDDSGPLKAGMYVARRGRIENYRPVVDLRDLTPVASPKG